jgi:hypothetical protein
LVSWAEHQFGLNKSDASGITKREHLEQVERQSGHTLKELYSEAEMPEVLLSVWSAFCDLNYCRSQGFSGPNPISYTEIKDWKDLTDNPISSREIILLRKLDQVYMRVLNG